MQKEHITQILKEFGIENPLTPAECNYILKMLNSSGDHLADAIEGFDNQWIFMFEAGYYSEALSISKIVFVLGVVTRGGRHSDAITDLKSVAACFKMLHRFQEALSCFEKILALSAEFLGEQNPDTITCLYNIAYCLEALGRYQEALSHHKEALALSIKIFDEGHLETIRCQSHLAGCLYALSCFQEALPHYEKVSTLSIDILGEQNPEAITYLTNLGACLRELHFYQEALTRLKRALTLSEEGEHDSQTITCLVHLGQCLRELNLDEEALPHFERALVLSIEIFGIRHLETIRCLGHLTRCLNGIGHYQMALPFHEWALALSSEILGEQHQETIACLGGIADCLAGLGRYQEALPYSEKALVALEAATFGERHLAKIRCLEGVGRDLFELGRFQEVLAYCEKALVLSIQIFGEQHLETTRCLMSKARCLDMLHRYNEALPLHEQSLAFFTEFIGERNRGMVHCLHNLAYCLHELGRIQEALLYSEKAFALSTEIFGEECPETIFCTTVLTCCLAELGRDKEVMPYLEKALASSITVFGEQHSYTIRILHDIGLCAEKCLDYAKALSSHLDTVTYLKLQPQLSKSWLDVLQSLSASLLRFVSTKKLTDWPPIFDQLNSALLAALDLQSPDQHVVARQKVSFFYSLYIYLCLVQRIDLLPGVLASMQGRKIAAWITEGLDTRFAEPHNVLLSKYRELRIKLRQIALGLSGSKTLPDLGQDNVHFHITQQQKLLNDYKQSYFEYQTLKQQIIEKYPELNVGIDQWQPDMSTLQAGLNERDAMVILLHFPIDGRQAFSVLLIRAEDYKLVPLNKVSLNTLFKKLKLANFDGTRKAFIKGESVGEEDHVRSFSLSLESREAERDPTPAEIASWMYEALWRALSENLENINHVHLVTQGVFHTLPFDMGCPEHLSLSTYPGLIYYHQRTREQISYPAVGSILSVNGYDALNTASPFPLVDASPIPLVNAELAMMQALWPGQVLQDASTDDSHAALFSCHGVYDAGNPTQSFLHLGADKKLAFDDVLRRRWPPVLFLSACLVGRITEDPDGEPLGLMGAFFLRGARVVIAALQRVSDIYMPILSVLFFQIWIEQQCDPCAALNKAKRRLKSGEWGEKTESLVRQHYPAAMEKALLHFLRQENDEQLMRFTKCWPFPEEFASLEEKPQQKLLQLKALLTERSARTQLINSIVENILQDRRNKAIDHLVTWVRAFGN